MAGVEVLAPGHIPPEAVKEFPQNAVVGKPLPCRALNVTLVGHCSHSDFAQLHRTIDEKREMTAQSMAYQRTLQVGGQAKALGFVALTATLVAAAATMAPPIRADMAGNAFLSALTNAGIAVTQPATTLAEGQQVCPMLVQPGGSFDSVVSDMATGNGMTEKNAGIFTILAIGAFCPSMIAPLIPDRFKA
jgi:hypothetical protein